MSSVGKDLRRRRQEADLSQHRLGTLADVSSSRVSDIERGRIANITVTTIERLYHALGVSLPWDSDGEAKGRYLRSLRELVHS